MKPFRGNGHAKAQAAREEKERQEHLRLEFQQLPMEKRIKRVQQMQKDVDTMDANIETHADIVKSLKKQRKEKAKQLAHAILDINQEEIAPTPAKKG